jgi:hypothetical protein
MAEVVERLRLGQGDAFDPRRTSASSLQRFVLGVEGGNETVRS